MDMYDILKKLNSVGSTPLYESAVPRAADVDPTKIPAYKRKADGEEKLTLKDLKAERSKSPTGAAGLKKLKDRTGVEEGIEQMVSSGHKIISNRKTPKGEFIVLQNKNDGKYEIHKFVGPASTTGYEFMSAYKTPQEMQSAFKSITGVAEGSDDKFSVADKVEELVDQYRLYDKRGWTDLFAKLAGRKLEVAEIRREMEYASKFLPLLDSIRMRSDYRGQKGAQNDQELIDLSNQWLDLFNKATSEFKGMSGQGVAEGQAPMYQVRDIKTNKVVGMHSADTGFKPSSANSGLKPHPTSIPNYHKIDTSVNFRQPRPQLSEIGDTPAGRAALKAVGKRADDEMTAWSADPKSGYSSTPKNVSKATSAGVAASNRLHGFGPDTSSANKVMARDASRRQFGEADVEEGNEYVNARRDAIRAGRPTFTVGGKTHKVTGDTSQEKTGDTSQEKTGVKESAEETPRGRIHRAAPGGYGRKYDQDDEEGDEKKAAASKKKAAAPPKINRGPGRPTSGRRPFSGDEAGKLQSYVVGNKPKDFDKGSGVEHGFSTAEKAARKVKAAADKAAYKATGVKPKRLDKDDVDEGESNREMSPQQLNQMWDRLGKGVARHKDDPAVQAALKKLEDSLNYLMTQGAAAGQKTKPDVQNTVTKLKPETKQRVLDSMGIYVDDPEELQYDPEYNIWGVVDDATGEVSNLKITKQPNGKLSISLIDSRRGVAEGEDEFDPANRGEYDREGEMAQDQLTTAADAASELRSILDSDENLPEWVQSKITKAVDYLDTARDYMKSKDDDEPVKEAGNHSARRARAGADIGKKPGKKPDFLDKDGNKKEPMKKAVADETAGPKKDVTPFAKKEVEETTTAGSVATAPAEGGKKTKGGVQFGKGVYEGALAESFSSKLKTMLNEEISMNLTTNSNGTKSLTVTATDDDAMRLAEILKLAGMESQAPAGDTAEACGACGQSPCGCDHIDEDDHANSPDPMYADTDTMVNTLSDGLNGRGLMVNPNNNTGDNPLAMKRLGVGPSPQVNLGSAGIGESIEKRLWTIYNRKDT